MDDLLSHYFTQQHFHTSILIDGMIYVIGNCWEYLAKLFVKLTNIINF